MAASGSQSLARSPGVSAASHADRPDRLAAAWVAAGPALLTLVVTLYRIGVPSFTRDEGATLLAVHRSFPQMIRMLGNVDVVHTEYYALIWVVSRLAGSGELAARAPSAVAMAMAAGVVTLLGQRLVSGRAGLAAGLLFAALPSVSFYAEDAREYALVTALATLASYFLVRALQAAMQEEGRFPRPATLWLAGYAAAMALLGLGNILSLLLIAAHAVTVAVWHRCYRGPGQPFVLRWLASAVVAVIVASPVAIIASGQAHQVQWIKQPGLVAIIAMAGLIGPQPMFLIVVAVVVIALVTSLVSGRARLRADWPAGLWGLALPWLFLPPALLFTVSVSHVTHPLYVFRYIAFCIPAAALLAGAALAALARAAVGWAVAAAALIVIVVAGLGAQGSERLPAGHGYDIRLADQAVASRARPGDALMNVRYWPLSWGGGVERGMDGEYPYGLARLHDISQARGPVPSATLGGTFARPSVENHRLAAVTRLWVASWSKAPAPLPQRFGFTVAYTLHAKGVWLRLYTRPHVAATESATGQPAG
ncbi:MAG TPA: glycosyltransferase family 39 protein [Streptosporangiaceae bacterium]|nr:glycosyltransferase family 39 protein [Streptosporangiaceae bacterium]